MLLGAFARSVPLQLLSPLRLHAPEHIEECSTSSIVNSTHFTSAFPMSRGRHRRYEADSNPVTDVPAAVIADTIAAE